MFLDNKDSYKELDLFVKEFYNEIDNSAVMEIIIRTLAMRKIMQRKEALVFCCHLQ